MTTTALGTVERRSERTPEGAERLKFHHGRRTALQPLAETEAYVRVHEAVASLEVENGTRRGCRELGVRTV